MNGIQEVPMSEDAPSANPIILIEKRCTKCGEIKSINSFPSRKGKKNGFSYWCKPCTSIYLKAYYQRNRERHRLNMKKWASKNRPRLRALSKKYREADRKKGSEATRRWRKANPEKIANYKKQWAIKNPEKVREMGRRYMATHKDEVNNRRRNWLKKNPEKKIAINKRRCLKRESDPTLRLNHRVSCSIRESLRNKNKASQHWEKLVGYTLYELIKHLEKAFEEGMSWENRNEWHIDHIVPISAFNFEKPEDEDFKRCWALKNLRPLWKSENLKKHTKLYKPFQPTLIFQRLEAA